MLFTGGNTSAIRKSKKLQVAFILKVATGPKNKQINVKYVKFNTMILYICLNPECCFNSSDVNYVSYMMVRLQK